ncbi:YihY/virulence factor BrkB family protein [Roseomonas elaeocarpi]|uniref:YihY/virulence factor BrkB family protein n=1 Tax=Roseomonas elaeocarpi TaxID=907779 RepID=A0ABV6JPJ3_9PROT
MFGKVWSLIKDTVEGYINDECLSRGAAIAYYTIFSIAPLLIIMTAIAGFFFGDEAVHGALDDQLRGMLGQDAAGAVQEMVKGASNKTSSTIATIVGIVTLLVTASGVFGELQASLNAIWKTEPPAAGTETTVTRLVRAKAASMGLVAATGFLLVVSLVVSAGISAVSTWLQGRMPGVTLLISAVNIAVSLGIITVLFAAMYKVLPDHHMEWKDVGVGAFVTAILFTIGKSLIGWYLGSSNMATSYGAASALVIILLWVYYSSQIFLMGAEFTRAYAGQEGSHQHAPVPADKKDAPTARRIAPAPASSLATPAPLVPKTSAVWSVLGVASMLRTASQQLRRKPSHVPDSFREPASH